MFLTKLATGWKKKSWTPMRYLGAQDQSWTINAISGETYWFWFGTDKITASPTRTGLIKTASDGTDQSIFQAQTTGQVNAYFQITNPKNLRKFSYEVAVGNGVGIGSNDIAQYIGLTYLKIRGLNMFGTFAGASFGNMTGLTYLSIGGGWSGTITGLPSSLLTLSLTSLTCTGTPSIPTSLTSLTLSYCSSLTGFPSMTDMTALTSLTVTSCIGMTTANPSLTGASALTDVNITGCTSLTGVPGTSTNANLINVTYSGNTGMTSGTCNFTGSTATLKTLYIANQNTGNPNITGCTALTSITLNSTAITSLPNLSTFTSLTTLDCHSSTSLTSIGTLPVSLTTLDCHSSTSLTSIGTLPVSLTYVSFNACSALAGTYPTSIFANGNMVYWDVNQTAFTGTPAFPSLAPCTNMTDFRSNGSGTYAGKLTGTITSLTALTKLITFRCAYNAGLTAYTSSTIATTCISFVANNCALPSAEINKILADFVVNLASRPAVGTITLNGGSNGAPTGQGLTDKASIIAHGWTVTTT
jgi:hypothetical protein